MINARLFEEIIYISNQGKLINKYLIVRIVKDLVSKIPYIATRMRFKKIKFKNDPKYSAMTEVYKGNMFFNIENCYKIADDRENVSILEKNLHVLATILHEVEHLVEPEKLKSKTFEGKLIEICEKQENYFENGRLNFEIYYSNPSEKIAHAMSYKKILDFLDSYPNFKEFYPKEYQAINNEYIEMLMTGYELSDGKYNIPLISFITAIKQTSCLDKINFKLIKPGEQKNIDKMNLEKRFMYGLPITEENVIELNKIKILTKGTK